MQSLNVTSTQNQERIPPINTIIKVDESRTPITTESMAPATGVTRMLFQILFYAQLILISILSIFLTIYGNVNGENARYFRPREWYPPLLTGTASAGILALTFQWIFADCDPSKVVRIVFWFSPVLTCAVGILFLLIVSGASTALGVIVIVFAFSFSVYTCWVNPRFEYAGKILSVSTSFPPAKTAALVTVSTITAVLYSALLVSGIGGATARGKTTANLHFLYVLFIVAMILSLAWTMQVVKNMLQVTISRVKYVHFAYGSDFDTCIAFNDTIKHLMGSVSIGSLLVPIFGFIRGSARGVKLVAGDTDEFMFSCADCYAAIGSSLGRQGNRWGFVHVGAYNKGFVRASIDTWEMFRRVNLEFLIDSDLTGVLCFLCGVIGGAVATLVAGVWAVVVHKSYAMEISIYAFIIGYFVCRISMAWVQACVSAYYVSYAENPQNPRFDSTIPVRIQELQRYQS